MERLTLLFWSNSNLFSFGYTQWLRRRAELYSVELVVVTTMPPGPLFICLELFSSILCQIWRFGFSSEEDAASFTLRCLSRTQTTAVFSFSFFQTSFFCFFSFGSQRRKHFHFRATRFFLVKAFFFSLQEIPPQLSPPQLGKWQVDSFYFEGPCIRVYWR